MNKILLWLLVIFGPAIFVGGLVGILWVIFT